MIGSRDACEGDELKTFGGQRANGVPPALSVVSDVFGSALRRLQLTVCVYVRK